MTGLRDLAGHELAVGDQVVRLERGVVQAFTVVDGPQLVDADGDVYLLGPCLAAELLRWPDLKARLTTQVANAMAAGARWIDENARA